MSQHKFDEWFEREYPLLHRAALGLGSWTPSDRSYASVAKENMRRSWEASRAATLEEATRICDDEVYAERAAERIRALGKGENE